MWAESDWPPGSPAVQLYLHEAPHVQAVVLAVGIVATVIGLVASVAAKAVFERHLKAC
jgi:hypothetical protein